jgi:hypothetical protein
MPTGKRCRLHQGRGLPPVEASGKPDQSETSGIGRTLRFDVALLIQRQLFTQKEILCSKRGAWAQAQEQEAQRIHEEHQPHACERYTPYKMAEQARAMCHCQGLPPRYGWWFLPIIAAGTCDVQSDEDRIFAEHSQGGRECRRIRQKRAWRSWGQSTNSGRMTWIIPPPPEPEEHSPCASNCRWSCAAMMVVKKR